jgi:hypothetical protein
MHKRLRSSRRALTKKVTSINFYVDQATQIQAIMEATGSMKEAPLVRQLVDEALAARRRKSVQPSETEQPPAAQDTAETLQTIQTLLLKLIHKMKPLSVPRASVWYYSRKYWQKPMRAGRLFGIDLKSKLFERVD